MSHHSPLTLKRISRRNLLRGSLASALGLALPGLGARAIAQSEDKEKQQPLIRVKFRFKDRDRMEDGRIVVEAQDGGIMLEGRDGQLWTILPEDLVSREQVENFHFQPYSSRQIADRLKAEFGTTFQTREFGPLVICTNTNRNYADWCGTLFLRLHRSFEKYWRRDKLPLKEPEFPLPILLFATRKQFAEYALATADAATAVSGGFYSLKTNRSAFYDLTADERGPAQSIADINRRMSKSLNNVATTVHEATHQFAFNGGLHTRYADNPLWLMEGMAMFFEVPDLNSRTGWASVGKPNKPRVARFAEWYKSGQRPEDSLKTLVQDDSRFVDPDTAITAYSEAWCLTYYLIMRRRDEYAAYLNMIAGKPRLKYLTPKERLKEFEKHFGNDWEELDENMVALLKRIRR
jgi:hypothetical protein